MKIEIKGNKWTISGEIDPKTTAPSKSGKSLVVATTNGFTSVTSDKGVEYKVSLNIITKEGLK